MPLRFSANFSDPTLDLDPFIDEVFSELKSGFLELPKGQGFVEYAVFEIWIPGSQESHGWLYGGHSR